MTMLQLVLLRTPHSVTFFQERVPLRRPVAIAFCMQGLRRYACKYQPLVSGASHMELWYARMPQHRSADAHGCASEAPAARAWLRMQLGFHAAARRGHLHHNH